VTEREGEGGGVGREGADEEFVAGGVAEGEGGAGAEGLREREEYLAVGGVGVEGEEEGRVSVVWAWSSMPINDRAMLNKSIFFIVLCFRCAEEVKYVWYK